MTTQESQIKQAAQCVSLDELRTEIDRLDRRLVKLLSERQRYIERAAEIKSHRDSVRDEARIAGVMSKVLAEARTAGLDAEIAGPVFRTLVECSIALEFRAFDARRDRSG
jgi:isochorismate pyruvate lyase